MKKHLLSIILMLLVIILVLCLSSCELLGEPGIGGDTPDTPDAPGDDTHIHTPGTQRYNPTSHYTNCTTCGEIIGEERHTFVPKPGYAATCVDEGLTDGEFCNTCGFVSFKQTVIEPTGIHNYVSSEVVAPTYLKDGCLSGMVCTRCRDIKDGTTILPAYSATCGTYAYEALGKRANGTAMQAAYQKLKTACGNFQDNPDADATYVNKIHEAFTVDFSDCGLTSTDDCFAVWNAVITDCPIFHWIANTATSDGSNIHVHVISTWASGERRMYNNLDLYEKLATVMKPEGTDYEAVLYLHNVIIEQMQYAYLRDGVTPDPDPSAHNITGFWFGRGVCEAYAETFSLYLNYWGIENTLVSGIAGGEAHEWNLVRMDDGEWYWFDLTWDDRPTDASGRVYDYFCKTDAEFGERTINTDLFSLPSRAPTPYLGSVPVIGDSFSTDYFTYSVVGYRELEINYIQGVSRATVYETVIYPNTSLTFTVVGIGNLDVSNTLLPAVSENVEAVLLPKSVRYIRGNAFMTAAMRSVSIDENNPHLFDDNRVAVYARDPQVLICVLTNTGNHSLTILNGTVGIAQFAFLYNQSLYTIILPTSMEFIEVQAIYDCRQLVHILYRGSSDAWARIDIAEFAMPEVMRIEYDYTD